MRMLGSVGSVHARAVRFFAMAALATLTVGVSLGARPSAQSDLDHQHAAWVLDCLARMETVKPGMTRADLFKVFKEEGGIYSGTWGHYVLKECPYFKVDVVFEPAVAGSLGSSPTDTIKTISRPYIQRSILN